MRRITGGKTRPNWEQLVEENGLPYRLTEVPAGDTPAGSRTAPAGSFSYWSEDQYYQFSPSECIQLTTAGEAIFAMLVEAGDYLLGTPDNLHGPGGAADLRKLRVPEWMWPQIRRTWDLDPARGSVYGRFDLCYGGDTAFDFELRTPKLYEFNADTPTSLPESSYVQWEWFTATRQGSGQFNDVYPQLVAAWGRNLKLIADDLGFTPVVTFACSAVDESGEDQMNTKLLELCCQEAGYETHFMYMEDIELRPDGRFYDDRGRHLDVIFKLHPWEYFRHDEFGRAAFDDMGRTGLDAPDGGYATLGNQVHARPTGTIWIEPPYKLLWSNKGILPVLWKLFGGDPERSRYLLEAYFDDEQPSHFTDFVRKPMLGREGANLTFVEGQRTTLAAQDGGYTEDGYVVQRTRELPDFADFDGPHRPVIGLWMVDGNPAGIGIRESTGAVTDNLSRFMPHVIA